MSIFRNVVLNLKTEEECDRAIDLYKEQLSCLTGEGIENVYICRLSKDSVLFFVTIDNEDNAKRIFETIFIHSFSKGTMPLDNLGRNVAYYVSFSLFIAHTMNYRNNIYSVVFFIMFFIFELLNGATHYHLYSCN